MRIATFVVTMTLACAAATTPTLAGALDTPSVSGAAAGIVGVGHKPVNRDRKEISREEWERR